MSIGSTALRLRALRGGGSCDGHAPERSSSQDQRAPRSVDFLRGGRAGGQARSERRSAPMDCQSLPARGVNGKTARSLRAHSTSKKALAVSSRQRQRPVRCRRASAPPVSATTAFSTMAKTYQIRRTRRIPWRTPRVPGGFADEASVARLKRKPGPRTP